MANEIAKSMLMLDFSDFFGATSPAGWSFTSTPSIRYVRSKLPLSNSSEVIRVNACSTVPAASSICRSLARTSANTAPIGLAFALAK
ncbi:hypothetical protein CA54_21900 [Symmachiella macrocystis]|uniref:Uncharacterized protein n=1 Tax=Symmachiella macrocystis TaxID=2527985 RepID=A0A5C6BMV7_9PLAN|nr:hypothetical protein CA54_21900 [Symmachiella macrocystis]